MYTRNQSIVVYKIQENEAHRLTKYTGGISANKNTKILQENKEKAYETTLDTIKTLYLHRKWGAYERSNQMKALKMEDAEEHINIVYIIQEGISAYPVE